MYVGRLALVDFRSYADVAIDFAPGVSVLIGRNGAGKTNLVEAIGYVASATSHRVAVDGPLVRTGAERAIVRATVLRDGREHLVEIEINPGRTNRARLNRAPVPRPREVVGILRTVLFAPQDIALVSGEPGNRRRFLDDVLTTQLPRYAGVRSDYERVLKQRNALLKSAAVARGRADLSTLDAWDAQLARSGADLLAGRLNLVDALRPLIEKFYAEVSGGSDAIGVEYEASLPIGEDRRELVAALMDALHHARADELDRGVTLVGPHRDELHLAIGGLPARGHASHGETWSLALALRLASYELLRSDGGEPVLVLDDVFAELDVNRRGRLADLVTGAEQVIVTAAVDEDVPLGGPRFEVRGGAVFHA